MTLHEAAHLLVDYLRFNKDWLPGEYSVFMNVSDDTIEITLFPRLHNIPDVEIPTVWHGYKVKVTRASLPRALRE